MEKDRGARVLSILAICVAIVGMTVGFATFSTTLNIEGTGTVKASKWGVIFENLQTVAITGTATQVTAPTINTNDTKISNYKVELKTPGDSISYTFDIHNAGTYDAEISSMTMVGLGDPAMEFSVTGSGDNKTTDEANVKAKLSYTLVYITGAKANQPVSVGDTLDADETVTAKLTLTYNTFTEESLLPVNDVEIGNLGININYVQVED